MMRRDLLRLALAVALLGCGSGGTLAADTRAKADVTCQSTSTALVYDCAIKLTDARTGVPLSGVQVTVGADMPSMPMAHNMRPAVAKPGTEPGLYTARIELEMHGDWALRIDIAGAVRDRVVKTMRFGEDQGSRGGHGASGQAPPAKPHGH
jgi:hypothetical protein